jgi:alkyl hydroperoxide reductase subunit AhpC
MSIRLGDEAPDFAADTTQGPVRFHEWKGSSWAVLFSHPKDFTPVCTTELGYMAKIKPEFDKRNCKIIALSVDPVDSHGRWLDDIKDVGGSEVDYPIIADTDLNVAKMYNMLPADEQGTHEGRTAATNQTVRTVFIIGPDKKIKALLMYPMNSGRNFDEVLRLLDSVQLTDRHTLATPANWQPGEHCIIPPSVSDDIAREKYPEGWETVKPYLRRVKQPAD